MPRSLRGFTLVELLVVLAILSVLMTLLLPAVQAARRASLKTECASHLKQLGIAFALYAEAYDGRFPRTHVGQADSWIATTSPFIEDVHAVRVCPLDPHRDRWMALRSTSYLMNEYVALPTSPAFPSVERIDQLGATSKTIVLFEGSDQRDTEPSPLTDPTRWAPLDHAHPGTIWFSPRNLANGRSWRGLTDEIQPDRHGEVAHFLYADGHVSAVAEAAVRERVAAADNFGLPNQGGF